DNRNEVCVEPEDGKWPVDLFGGLPNLIETEVANHPDRNIVFYGDPASMREMPEYIRQDSVRRAVQNVLVEYDSSRGVASFAGRPAPVDAFDVVPVLQVPTSVFESFRPLPKPVSDGIFSGHASLIHAALAHVLDEAHDELLRPDPGRSLLRSRSTAEIARQAAGSFMRTPTIALKDRGFGGSELFDRFNMISSLMYEGARGTGRLLLTNPESGSVDLTLTFAEAVPFREPRWARKALEMAAGETSLVADCEKIFGLGQLASGVDPWTTQDVFQIEFLDHYHWRLSCGEEVMLISRYGTPSLPQEPFPTARLTDTYQRLFPDARPSDLARFMGLFRVAVNASHGSTLVTAQDAEGEAQRLERQGARVAPTRLTPELFQQVSSIDGAILVDPRGDCHAVGVILDGAARSECKPARGSRYNSAIRYVLSCDTPRLAVVVSDDRTVDVVPHLHPRIKSSAVRKALDELESSSKDDYHEWINWLARHRFYLDQGQCDRINAALGRIGREPREVGEIHLVWDEFVPHPDFDESYLEYEDAP
ncbi:MAG: diadenylate cyclase, partial [Gammaproteobacteria bacterium]|nr:diadenylate cyclase [Gammaproteobacteria bacterium]